MSKQLEGNLPLAVSLTKKFLVFINTISYQYKTSENGETGLVEKYTSTVGSSVTEYTYTYDSKGNITGIAFILYLAVTINRKQMSDRLGKIL